MTTSPNEGGLNGGNWSLKQLEKAQSGEFKYGTNGGWRAKVLMSAFTSRNRGKIRVKLVCPNFGFYELLYEDL
jgi:hypothetical protein